MFFNYQIYGNVQREIGFDSYHLRDVQGEKFRSGSDFDQNFSIFFSSLSFLDHGFIHDIALLIFRFYDLVSNIALPMTLCILNT